MEDSRIVIGIISDTHGMLPAAVKAVFSGVQEIIHAGDIGSNDVLQELRMIAPVQAVYGNMDDWPMRLACPRRLELDRAGVRILVNHIDCVCDDDPRFTICISGHTHQPLIERRENRLIINPGSASRPPQGQPGSAAILRLQREMEPQAEIIFLENSG